MELAINDLRGDMIDRILVLGGCIWEVMNGNRFFQAGVKLFANSVQLLYIHFT